VSREPAILPEQIDRSNRSRRVYRRPEPLEWRVVKTESKSDYLDPHPHSVAVLHGLISHDPEQERPIYICHTVAWERSGVRETKIRPPDPCTVTILVFLKLRKIQRIGRDAWKVEWLRHKPMTQGEATN